MLQGLGEPIRELRLFVKDLCFRNSQERRRGELQLAREELAVADERMRLAMKYGLLETPQRQESAEAVEFAPPTVERASVPRELPPGGC